MKKSAARKKKSAAAPGQPRASRRAKVQIGGSEINPSDLKGLRSAWRQKHLVLFLGAGVSIPYGLPSWRNLVLELLFEQTQHTKRLGDFWPHYRRALASWMMDYFDYDPLILGRMIERDIRLHPKRNEGRSFIEKLRERLYAQHKSPSQQPTVLQSIARFIAQNSSTHGVQAAVTFNYDDLLEQELTALGVRVMPVIDHERQHGPGFPVVHPHGYVPASGPASRDTLVFTEGDYHKLTDTVFHWSLSEIVGYLRKSTVLFIGLSMSDPSLRRLLDACRNSTIPPHWQIQKRHEVRDSEMQEVMNDVERRARFYGRILENSNVQKETKNLEEAIHDALRQADTYDSEVFESMGVKTIWIHDWPDITPLIEAISH